MAKATPAKKTVKVARKIQPAKKTGVPTLTAKNFIVQLEKHQSDEELKKIQRYFKSGKGEYGEGDTFIGVRMGHVFALAKTFIDMPPAEIEKLLKNPVHEMRAGAVSIMNQQGRTKKTTDARRKELYDLYLKNHRYINNWDLVDLGAAYVIGAYLFDKPRKILYKLAQSRNIWERRTAIVSTFFFIRQGQIDDTFAIGELLLFDKEDLIQKAVGGWIREAGKRDRNRLLALLDRYAATMPRTCLRYAIERLDKKQRDYYLKLKEE